MRFYRLLFKTFKFALLLKILLISGCGGPSPWANWLPSGLNDLTRKSLEDLGSGESKSEFAVGLIANPQVTPGYLRMAAQRLNHRGDIDFSIILGDLTDRSLNEEFIWVGNIVVEAHRPMLTIVGNHDGLIHGEEIYRSIFGPLNYTFQYGGVTFAMWNNNPYEWGYPDFDWLRQVIESHTKVIIVAHQPPRYIARYPSANDELIELYQHPHVLGSVHGHRHHFELQTFSGKPAMTVARVIDEKYAIMLVHEDGRLTFDRCEGALCAPQP